MKFCARPNIYEGAGFDTAPKHLYNEYIQCLFFLHHLDTCKSL